MKIGRPRLIDCIVVTCIIITVYGLLVLIEMLSRIN